MNPTNNTPFSAQAMDVVAAPPAEKQSNPETEPTQESKHHRKSAPQAISNKSKQPKEAGSGVGLAIFATVIIVLSLSALATYAYLQTK